MTAHGCWSSWEAAWPINHIEIRAICLALIFLPPGLVLSGPDFLRQCHSEAYVRQGTTKSARMALDMTFLFSLGKTKPAGPLGSTFCRCFDNVKVDYFSRHSLDPKEWESKPFQFSKGF